MPNKLLIKNKVIIIRLGEFDVKIEFKKIKHIYLRIEENSEIKVSMPLRYKSYTQKQLNPNGESILSTFINKKKNWIKKRKKRIQTSTNKSFYCDNGYFYHFSEKNRLIIIPSLRIRCYLENGRLTIHTPNSSPVIINKIIENWQREELKKRIYLFSQKWEKIMRLKAKEYRIRKMKTRWGTCNPSARRIWINLALIKKPEICLEYILVHELVHFLERDHNNRFYSLMTRFLPKWKKYKKILNGKMVGDDGIEPPTSTL